MMHLALALVPNESRAELEEDKPIRPESHRLITCTPTQSWYMRGGCHSDLMCGAYHSELSRARSNHKTDTWGLLLRAVICLRTSTFLHSMVAHACDCHGARCGAKAEETYASYGFTCSDYEVLACCWTAGLL